MYGEILSKKKDLREFSIQIFIENYLFEKYFDIYYVWFYVYNLSTRYFLKYFVKNLKEVEKASQTEKFHQIRKKFSKPVK